MDRRRGILAHPEDLHCVVYHLLVVASYGMAFWIYLNRVALGLDSAAEMGAFTVAAIIMLGWISGIDVGVNFHNHVHRPVFRSAFLNRWFGRVWTVTGGWPSFFWDHSHTTVHHDHILSANDWTLPKRREDGSMESLFVYSFAHWPWRYAVHLWKDFRSGRGGAQGGRQAIKELLIFLVLWSIPFFVDPLMALLFWVGPHFFANVYVMGPGMYAQHYGCEEATAESPYSHSNTFISKFFNLTMFNIGYHIEHHDHPNVHWSALPRLHAYLKKELADGGGHIVPFGYYRGGQLLSSISAPARGRRIFAEQHPDYPRSQQRAEPSNSQASALRHPEAARDSPETRSAPAPRP